ncbi:MAG: hypothetical protein ACLQVG_00910 [Terriglobia bacterium]
MEDIFVYARKCVDNKSVFQRIGHSAKLHSVRSAVSSQGSAASKLSSLGGVAIRATLQAIPLPAVGSLIASIEEAVEKAIKGALHHRSIAKAQTTEEKIKFQLKELNVEELDRYRWKVQESIKEFNKALQEFDANFVKKRDAAAPCDAFLEVALAGEQASRRIHKLRDACLGLHAAMILSMDWLWECELGAHLPAVAVPPAPPAPSAATQGVMGRKNDFMKVIKMFIDQERNEMADLSDENKKWYVSYHHANCDRWCCWRDAGTVDNWAKCKENCAFVLRTLSDPFAPDSFSNNLGSLW